MLVWEHSLCQCHGAAVGTGDAGGYLIGRATLLWGVTAPRDVSACLWIPRAGPTSRLTSSSSFPTASLHKPLPLWCHLSFPVLENSRFWPNTCIFHQEQSKKPHQETKLSFKLRLSRTTSSSKLKTNPQRRSKGRRRLRRRLRGAGTAHTYD